MGSLLGLLCKPEISPLYCSYQKYYQKCSQHFTKASSAHHHHHHQHHHLLAMPPLLFTRVSSSSPLKASCRARLSTPATACPPDPASKLTLLYLFDLVQKAFLGVCRETRSDAVLSQITTLDVDLSKSLPPGPLHFPRGARVGVQTVATCKSCHSKFGGVQ